MSCKILLVDDDDVTRRRLSQALVHVGHEVIEARNGRAALQLFPVHLPAFVVTTIFMPDMDGIEVIRALGRNQQIVPIMIALLDETSPYARYLKGGIGRLGAAAVLSRPLEPGHLVAMMQKLIEERIFWV